MPLQRLREVVEAGWSDKMSEGKMRFGGGAEEGRAEQGAVVDRAGITL